MQEPVKWNLSLQEKGLFHYISRNLIPFEPIYIGNVL